MERVLWFILGVVVIWFLLSWLIPQLPSPLDTIVLVVVVIGAVIWLWNTFVGNTPTLR